MRGRKRDREFMENDNAYLHQTDKRMNQQITQYFSVLNPKKKAKLNIDQFQQNQQQRQQHQKQQIQQR